MKRYLTLSLLILTMAGCSKKQEQAPADQSTVEYRLDVANAGNYHFTYRDGTNAIATADYTGTSFSKTITTTRSTGFTRAEFTATCTDQVRNTTGTLTINVNGKVGFQAPVTFDSGHAGYSYWAVVY